MTYNKIILGDAVELASKLKERKINCIITDPPFGVDSQMNSATTEAGRDHARKIANDSDPVLALRIFYSVMDELLQKVVDQADVYVFTAQQVLKEWLVGCDAFMAGHNFERRHVLVWEKGYPGKGDLDSWGIGYEFILQYKRGRRLRSDHKRLNGILHVDNLSPASLIHPHEKPEGIIELLLRHSTVEGDWVVDPFAGSGSTIRAARNLGRNSLGFELDERNYRAACDKLEQGGLFV